jgi:hypothetical protein
MRDDLFRIFELLHVQRRDQTLYHFTRRSWRKIIGTPLNEDVSTAEVEWDGDNKAWTRRNDSNNYCLASQLVRCARLSSYNTQLTILRSTHM